MFYTLLLFGLLTVSEFIHAESIENDQLPISLTYCVDPDWMPYEAIRNGVHVGISADYLAFIAEKANLSLTLKRTSSWDESLRLAAQGVCHFLPMLNQSPSRMEYLLFSDSFFTSPNVLVAQTGTQVINGYEAIGDKVLGVVNGYRHEEYIERYYPQINTKRFDSEIALLRALSEGQVDLSVGSLLSVNSRMQKEGLSNIQVVGLAQPHDQLRIGVSLNAEVAGLDGQISQALVNRFNSAIASIPEQVHVNIYRQWNNVKVIEHTNYEMFLWPLVLLTMFSLMLAWRTRSVSALNRSLAKSNQRLETLQKQLIDKNQSLEFLTVHDQLTGLYNRNFMLHRVEEALHTFERFGQPVSLVVMDVDFFKSINDRFGHATGDRVLTQIAKITQSCLREVDLIARWGGEEFLILCPSSDGNAAKVLAERIMQGLKVIDLGNAEVITCSFGIAELSAGQDFSTWFDNADKAMYLAKKAGRDQIIVYDK